MSVTGKHRVVDKRRPWRRAPAVVPVQRVPGIELVDARTLLAHQVSTEELVAGHRRGDYLGLCGARFRAACLVEPGRGRCAGCWT